MKPFLLDLVQRQLFPRVAQCPIQLVFHDLEILAKERGLVLIRPVPKGLGTELNDM